MLCERLVEFEGREGRLHKERQDGSEVAFGKVEFDPACEMDICHDQRGEILVGVKPYVTSFPFIQPL